MDDSEKNANIAVAYVQRQEQLLIEQIRKTIQLEVSYGALKSELDEAKKQEVTHLDIIKQMSASIEDLTLQNKKLEKSDGQLRARISEVEAANDVKLKNVAKETEDKIKEVQKLAENHVAEYTNEIGELNVKLNNLTEENKKLKHDYDEINTEYARQKAELQEVFNENENLKKKK